MQEEVGVNRLVDRGLDGLHVVVEDANPKLHAFGLQLGFDEVQQLGVRNRGGSYAEGLGLDAGSGQGKHGNSRQAAGKFLDHRYPVRRLEVKDWHNEAQHTGIVVRFCASLFHPDDGLLRHISHMIMYHVYK